MDYYGLLFLYYLKGLSGKSVLRLFFNIEAGGTEQLLPENASTPTTTPILADIQYPDGLRTDQYFTYRETPTTVSNKARIKTIKGNTLLWNQLVQNGNFADTSIWSVTGSGSSFTVSNNIATIIANGAYDRIQQNVEFIKGHKYLIKADVKKTNDNDDIRLYYGTHLGTGSYTFAKTTEWQTKSIIKTATENITTTYPNVEGTTSNLTWQQRNMMIIDLTQMGLDISSPSEFTSFFPLPYYAYNQGTLLSFNGNGIKTVGKNIFDGVLQNGTIDQYGQEQSQANRYRSGFIRVFPSTRYVLSVDGVIKNVNIFYYDTNKNFISTIGGSLVTTPSNCAYMRFYYDQSILNVNLQLEMLKSGDSPTPYEPYKESALSLPISQYFPSGMKSAGNVYDELTETKAITRIGSVDLGSLTWSYNEQYQCFMTYPVLTDAKYIDSAVIPNFTSIYRAVSWSAGATDVTQDMATCFLSSANQLRIRNKNFTDATTFKSAMSGVYLYYELATPTETPITTEDANEALSLLMGKSVSSNNAKQMIDIITKGE